MKTATISVELIDYMGNDLTVVNAARVSMHKESDWNWTDDNQGFGDLKKSDAGLIAYLAKHQHWTPFSHPQISFRIKAPIFVARQWFKHMIGITRNEVSRRYVDEEPEFYLPESWRTRPDGSIKQGSGGTHPETDKWAAHVEARLWHVVNMYEDMIADGVAPEQARMVLPQNMMAEWIETASLAAVCRACKLRLDEHAQQETREIAEQIAEQVAPLFPASWSALMEN